MKIVSTIARGMPLCMLVVFSVTISLPASAVDRLWQLQGTPESWYSTPQLACEDRYVFHTTTPMTNPEARNIDPGGAVSPSGGYQYCYGTLANGDESYQGFIRPYGCSGIPASSDRKFLCDLNESDDDEALEDDGRACEMKGNPCNVSTGNKYQVETDFYAGDMKFVRSYNSRNNAQLGGGKGWRHNYQRKLIVNGGLLTQVTSSGKGEKWEKVNGVWQGEADSSVLIIEGTVGFTLTLPNGDMETYDFDGKLLQQNESNGQVTTYGYDLSNQLVLVANSFGHTISFTYLDGLIDTVTDPSGAVYIYEYDNRKNLVKVIYPDLTIGDTSDNPYKTYHYENGGFKYYLTGITDANGDRFATWDYATNGKAVLTRHAQTTNAVGQETFTFEYTSPTTTTVTDAGSGFGPGTQEIYTFDEILGVKKLTSKINQVDGKGITQTWDANGNKLTRTDAVGRVTSYTYNATNQKVTMTEAFGTPQARTTTYEYVSADVDLVTKVISPSIYATNSKEVITAYDANQNVTAVTINGFDAQGNAVTRVTSFAHDVFGKVTQIDGPRTDVSDITLMEYYDCNTGAECGQLKKVTNALGHETTYDAYDAAARLLQSTGPNGTITSYVYHPRGWLLSMTQTPTVGTPRTTTYEYDLAGQVVKTTQADGVEQSYVYDAAHDLREITDNLGNKVEYTYDAKGNRTNEIVSDPDATLVRSTTTSYNIRNFVEAINSGGSVTQLVNDAVGNLSSQTDPNVNPTTDHTFDALDRLTNTVDALANNSDYIYNVADQLTQVAAPNGAVTVYEYDDLGNQTQEISADRGTISYTHDAAGNVTSMTDARGITANYQYDALNRLTAVVYPTASENISYTYDATCVLGIGRLCQVQDNSGVSTFQYDAWGNVLSIEKTERDSTNTVIGTYLTLYEYDAGNRVTGIQYPSGRIVSITRDVLGRLSGVDSLDTEGQATNIVTGRTYRADGLWTAQSYGNGLDQTKQYDTQGRLLDHLAGGYSRDYQYDANGNILSADATDNTRDRDYDYDVLDRLISENDAVKALLREFQYDANGNREQFSEAGQTNILTYTPNSNRLSAIDNAGIVLDASGRTVSDAQGRLYTYNNAGRIKSIAQGGQTLGEYTYNSQQLRTQKSIGNTTTVFHYDSAGNLIAESDQAGNTLQEYVYADGERVATYALSSGPDQDTGTDPATVAAISLDTHQAYGGSQDQANTGAVTLAANNTSITLDGNRWRAVPFNYTITPTSILEFDFSSTQQGEIHGIGLDTDLAISANRTFAVDGTQNWGLSAFKGYSGGTQHFTIPVGQFYTGAVSYLGFTMDDDAAKVGNSVFSNIKVYEGQVADTQGILNLVALQPYGGNQDQASTGPVENPDAQTVRLKGNRWQKVYAPVTITPSMELHFEFKSDTQGEIHGIGVDSDNAQSATQTFNIWGTQNWGDRSHYGYSGNGDYQSYQIPIGQVLSGDFTHLTFLMDDDANSQGESVFRNVQFIDPLNPPAPTQEVGVQFYVNDHLMTPQLAVNVDNEITWQADYTAFGKADISIELFTNNHRFPGQYFDAESGLVYNWNRYYDTVVGRYVTSDPIGLGGGLNTFGYVNANPLILIDPKGMQSFGGFKFGSPEGILRGVIESEYPGEIERLEASAKAKLGCVVCTATCWVGVGPEEVVEVALLYAEAERIAKQALISGAKKITGIAGLIDGVVCSAKCLQGVD